MKCDKTVQKHKLTPTIQSGENSSFQLYLTKIHANILSR